MSGLGHFIESEGVPTAGISLVREHTAHSPPPRALWVPFDFGLPFGAPGDAILQHRVLLALLNLFGRDSGPVLEIFPEGDGAETQPARSISWSCPLPEMSGHTDTDMTAHASLEDAVQDELRSLLPWYEHAIAERRRTTVGASGIDVPILVPFIAGFLSTPLPTSPTESLPLPLALKAAVEDLKQVYLEAVSARPEASEASHGQLNDWFWRETRAAELLRAVAESVQQAKDTQLDVVAKMLLVPAAYSE